MQLIHSAKHLANVEPRVLLLEHTGIVEERAEVTAGDEVLCERWRGRRGRTRGSGREEGRRGGKEKVSDLLSLLEARGHSASALPHSLDGQRRGDELTIAKYTCVGS